MQKYFRRTGTALVALITASSIFQPAKAEFDPVTVGMTVGLLNQGLSMFGSKADPQAAEMGLILANVEAINRRLTSVEDNIIGLMELVSSLPAAWRESLKSLLDTIRI